MSTRTERFADKSLNDKHVKILKDLMQRPDNRRCADCRKRDPRWASWNLGIFMCIRCSGIHRSLGVHISKVKSADLDTWTPEQIQNMQRWGNGKANQYWEHELPDNIEPPEGSIEQWIRAKYERKQFAMKGPIPDPDTLGLKEIAESPKTALNRKPTPPKAVFNTVQEPVQQPPLPPRSNVSSGVQRPVPPIPIPVSNLASSPMDDLLGLVSAPSSSPNPSTATNYNKIDKANILSLYSSTSVPKVPAQNVAFANFASFNPPPPSSSTSSTLPTTTTHFPVTQSTSTVVPTNNFGNFAQPVSLVSKEVPSANTAISAPSMDFSNLSLSNEPVKKLDPFDFNPFGNEKVSSPAALISADTSIPKPDLSIQEPIWPMSSFEETTKPIESFNTNNSNPVWPVSPLTSSVPPPISSSPVVPSNPSFGNVPKADSFTDFKSVDTSQIDPWSDFQ